MLTSFQNQRQLKIFYVFLVMFLHGWTPLSLSTSTEAGSVCNERRCDIRNPFTETYRVVQNVELKQACEATLKKPVCEKVKDKSDLKNCNHPDDLMPPEKASATYAMGCMLGVQSFSEGLWEMIKAGGRLTLNAAKMPFSPETREKWQRDYNARFIPAREKFISFIKSSYRKKYEAHRKRYARGQSGDLWASVRVAESVFPGMWSKVMKGISEKMKSFSCMNRMAQTRMGCMVMSELGFEFMPALMTGGMTLAVGMAIKAKKGTKIVEILEADVSPSSSLPSTVQTSQSNALTRSLDTTKQKTAVALSQSRFLPLRLRTRFMDFKTIPQDTLFAIVNTPHLLARLSAEQLQNIPDHLILKMDQRMQKKLAAQMFKQGVRKRGQLLIYRVNLRSWAHNEMKEFIQNPPKTQADLDSFIRNWKKGDSPIVLYEDQGFNPGDMPEWTISPEGNVEYPPEFQRAFMEEAKRRGLLQERLQPNETSPTLLIPAEANKP